MWPLCRTRRLRDTAQPRDVVKLVGADISLRSVRSRNGQASPSSGIAHAGNRVRRDPPGGRGRLQRSAMVT